MLQYSPHSDGVLTLTSHPGFSSGSTLVLLPRFDAHAAVKLLESEGITFFAGVPTMYWGLLGALEDAQVDVDKIARDVIAEAGYGEWFGHSLGHGIGLDIHEQPRLAPSSDSVLKPGMVVTVEPGIYLPHWGGVRIEDDVLVTETGCEVLSHSLSTRLDDMLWPVL